MNPYAPYNQGYVGPQILQSPPTPQGHVGRRPWNKAIFGKTTRNIFMPVVACILIQAVASFYYITTFFTFEAAVRAKDNFEGSTGDFYRIQIVFNIFSAIAFAMCAPMIKNSGYTTIVISGTVLLIFSTVSSSLVTSARLLAIPYGVFGAVAFGLLKVGPEVAMLDYLNNRRSLATGLSYLGVTIGQVSGTLCFIFTNMAKDATVKDDWKNNLRIIEVSAVIGFMGAALLRKPSFAIGKFPELFQYKPFYIICFIQFFLNAGFTLFQFILQTATEERDIKANLSESALLTPFYMSLLAELAATLLLVIVAKFMCNQCCKSYPLLITGLAVGALAGGSFPHDYIFESFWPLASYAMAGGALKALCRTSVPLAMIVYVGRANNKLALPFLELTGGLGSFLTTTFIAEVSSSDFNFDIKWYTTGGLFAVCCVLSFCVHCLFPEWEIYSSGGDEIERKRIHMLENAAFEPEEDEL